MSRSLERVRVTGACARGLTARPLGSTQWDALVAGLELARHHRLLEPDVATSCLRPPGGRVSAEGSEAARGRGDAGSGSEGPAGRI